MALTPDLPPNFAVAVITTPNPGSAGTSITVTAGQGARFLEGPPTTEPYNVIVRPASALPDPTNSEIVRVTKRVGDTFTVLRKQENTNARNITAGDLILHGWTEANMRGWMSGLNIEGGAVSVRPEDIAGGIDMGGVLTGSYTIYQFRRGLAATWNTAPGKEEVLAEGEVGFEIDTGKGKVGDGLTPWEGLPYVFGTTGSGMTETVAKEKFLQIENTPSPGLKIVGKPDTLHKIPIVIGLTPTVIEWRDIAEFGGGSGGFNEAEALALGFVKVSSDTGIENTKPNYVPMSNGTGQIEWKTLGVAGGENFAKKLAPFLNTITTDAATLVMTAVNLVNGTGSTTTVAKAKTVENKAELICDTLAQAEALQANWVITQPQGVFGNGCQLVSRAGAVWTTFFQANITQASTNFTIEKPKTINSCKLPAATPAGKEEQTLVVINGYTKNTLEVKAPTGSKIIEGNSEVATVTLMPGETLRFTADEAGKWHAIFGYRTLPTLDARYLQSAIVGEAVILRKANDAETAPRLELTETGEVCFGKGNTAFTTPPDIKVKRNERGTAPILSLGGPIEGAGISGATSAWAIPGVCTNGVPAYTAAAGDVLFDKGDSSLWVSGSATTWVNSSHFYLKAEQFSAIGKYVAQSCHKPEVAVTLPAEKIYLAKIMWPWNLGLSTMITAAKKKIKSVYCQLPAWTTAPEEAIIGIIDESGNLLAKTANFGATLNKAGAFKIALESPIEPEGGVGKFLYIAFWRKGGTYEMGAAQVAGNRYFDLNANLPNNAEMRNAEAADASNSTTFATFPSVNPVVTLAKNKGSSALHIPLLWTAVSEL